MWFQSSSRPVLLVLVLVRTGNSTGQFGRLRVRPSIQSSDMWRKLPLMQHMARIPLFREGMAHDPSHLYIAHLRPRF
ncbi:hypothetical protein L210DRAFT_3589366 [Boletus edulis BED1]|uniref:Secreted protein n=1 Tax=Boletus edulis BED1 TaxID=1328754 RepID=A0AAD4G4M2_BOLED|nr:hypothetical protein L210DRAFT_3589366 [Boletus edulis BED1]